MFRHPALKNTFKTKKFNQLSRNNCTTATGRKPLQWNHPDFHDEKKLEQEIRRVFDVCHGCRACFNLCDSFPTLFSLIDSSSSNELDTVPSNKFKVIRSHSTQKLMLKTTKGSIRQMHTL